MELIKYVNSVLKNKTKNQEFPYSLVLSKITMQKFKLLLEEGRRDRKEYGYRLLCDNQVSKIEYSQLYTGSRHGVSLGEDKRKENFGSVHCHPGLNISKGEQAHSPADLMGMEKELKKPLFIAFVASGKAYTNYAVVYRNGVSSYNATLIGEMNKSTQSKMNEYLRKNKKYDTLKLSKIANSVREAKTWEEVKEWKKWVPLRKKSGKLSKEEQWELWEDVTTQAQRKLVKYGELCVRISIDNLKRLDKECNFGFYVSKKGRPDILERY